MAQQLINVGLVGNDNTGDYLRPAFIKINENFSNLYEILITDLADVAYSGDYNDLNNRPALGTSAGYNVGVLEGDIVQVQAGGKLPALDGSLLTNISGGGGGGGAVDVEGTPTTEQNVVWVDNNTIKGVTPLTGGAEGQGLAKVSGTNYDYTWVTSTGSLDAVGVPVGGQIALWFDANTLQGVTTIPYTFITGLGTAAVVDIEDYNFVPDGGTVGQVLAKINSTDGNTEWVNAINSLSADPNPTLSGDLIIGDWQVGPATPSDLAKLNEIVATSVELNYSSGVTDYIQDQLNSKLRRSVGETAPSSVPQFPGDVYVDQVGQVAYIAVGNSSISHWTGIVSGAQSIKTLLETLSPTDGIELITTLGGLTEDDIEDATIATAADINNNTSGDLFMTPTAFNASNSGKDHVAICSFGSSDSVVVGDGTDFLTVPATWNGLNIKAVLAGVSAKGVTGATDVQVRRKRGATSVDVLSTKVTIGDEFFAADGVINTSNDDLATGDKLFIDVDAIHSGTAPLGLSVTITVGI